MATPIKIVVDGGCTVHADNAPGSWAALLVAYKPDGSTVEKVPIGSVENTTNNRMELTAVIEGLRAETNWRRGRNRVRQPIRRLHDDRKLEAVTPTPATVAATLTPTAIP